MSKKMMYLAVVIVIVAVSPALAVNYQVGGCLAKLQNFGTIQSAVNSVPAGATILICPGVYPEQVTISKPVTLRGQVMVPLNTGRPIITVSPARGLQANVTNIQGTTFAAQVLVTNVHPAGFVDILGVTIDGSGANLGCSSNIQLAGLFYASGTFGNIEDTTARNQQNNGCGFGIWVENGAGASQTIGLAGNSVHDMDNTGIVALSDQNPPTLTVSIKNNSVTGNNGTQGIAAENISGNIQQNVVTGGGVGIADVDFFPQLTPGITISDNTVADIQAGAAIGIVVREGSTAMSNKISNVLTGFFLQGGNANPGAKLEINTLEKTNVGIEANCAANVVFQNNVLNDSMVAYDKVPSGTSLHNKIFNIDVIQTGTCP
jgi:hypothetical protein